MMTTTNPVIPNELLIIGRDSMAVHLSSSSVVRNIKIKVDAPFREMRELPAGLEEKKAPLSLSLSLLFAGLESFRRLECADDDK